MRSKPMILRALLLAAFLVNLDTTLVNVALPAIVRELHATTTQLKWVVDAYNLDFAALLMTYGIDGEPSRAPAVPAGLNHINDAMPPHPSGRQPGSYRQSTMDALVAGRRSVAVAYFVYLGRAEYSADVTIDARRLQPTVNN